ncbi:MAG: hypothetical protein GSR84_04500 [Desulfurococcales archaeon]|nr:hypothetical protein [Desulfurococcales archaeon]
MRMFLILIIMSMLAQLAGLDAQAYQYPDGQYSYILLEPGDTIEIEGFIRHGGVVVDGKACAVVSMVYAQIDTLEKWVYSYNYKLETIGATQGLYYRTAVPDLLKWNWTARQAGVPHFAFADVIATGHDKVKQKIQEYGMRETGIYIRVEVGTQIVDYYDDVAKNPVYPITIYYRVEGQGFVKEGTLNRYLIPAWGGAKLSVVGYSMLSGYGVKNCKAYEPFWWYTTRINGKEVQMSNIVTVVNPPFFINVKQGEKAEHTMIVRSQYKLMNIIQLTIATSQGVYKISTTPTKPWGPNGPSVYLTPDSDLDLSDYEARITLVVDATNSAPGEYTGDIDFFVYGYKILSANITGLDLGIDQMEQASDGGLAGLVAKAMAGAGLVAILYVVLLVARGGRK